jgi:hypothetical protein
MAIQTVDVEGGRRSAKERNAVRGWRAVVEERWQAIQRGVEPWKSQTAGDDVG